MNQRIKHFEPRCVVLAHGETTPTPSIFESQKTHVSEVGASFLNSFLQCVSIELIQSHSKPDEIAFR